MSDTIAPPGDIRPHAMIAPSGQANGNGSGKANANGGRDDPHQKKSNVRKRTKTGCLTCRKRRIKCDEGRPTCNNCLKSKRHCEGYNQRVVFKDPFRAQAHPLNGPFDPLSYLSSHGHHLSQFGSLSGRPGHGTLPNLAPKPPPLDYMTMQNGMPHGLTYHPQPSHLHCVPPAGRPVYTPHGFQEPSASPLAPPPLSNFGPLGPFQSLGPQPLVDQHNLGLQIRPTNSAMFRDLRNPNGTPITTTHKPHAPPLPAQSQLPLTSVPHDNEDAWFEDSDGEHESSVALVAPVVQKLYTPGLRDTSMRSFSQFASSNAVSEYMISPSLSELKDKAKRDIFEHFMRVTGPSMSLYERHPFDASEQQVADSIPGSGTNIWSYTFPILAFQHSALLHAILASASLQLAKLQGTPDTAAIKHYNVALRRVGKNVRTPVKRKHPATLAATLLLGYYEVWDGNHNKWCDHLYGARILFSEMQLRDMSKRCLAAKASKDRLAARAAMIKMGLCTAGAALPKDPNELDFGLLSTISGYHLDASDYYLTDEQLLSMDHSQITERDLRDYENLRDLFWWYCKMDVYQGILGGTPLFMEYEDWTQCLPRAPSARLDRIYGTYDHLMLLLGRLVSFASKDLYRKRRHNRPFGSGSSSPPWPGMIPTKGEFRVPMGFSPPKQTTPQPDPTEGMDAEASRSWADNEWNELAHAFDVFESHLQGPEFQPLGAEYADHRDHPFGPALQYRTYSVAGIWMNFYMGRIHLHRSHPSMPPSAMPSVGLAASRTGFFANCIGRIAVGLADDFGNVQEVSTVMAAALIESAFCLFVAAVQYQDDAQRRWVVKRMLDITRLTGWQSARQIAEGCEASWTKAAEMGVGPQYARMAMPPEPPEIVWHNVRRIDRRIHEVDERPEERRVILARSERAQYALGLLGIEDDIAYLELKDQAFSGREV